MATTSAGSSRRWVQRGLVLLLAVVALEALLQALTLASPTLGFALLAPWDREHALVELDERLGHKGSPRYPGHDAWGFRNPERLDRAEILVVGDSQTYGIHVPSPETWPHRLAVHAGRSVYGMAIPGWGPVQYRAAYRQGLELEPDVVVLALYFGNDFYDAFRDAYTTPGGADLRDPARIADFAEPARSDPLLSLPSHPDAEPETPRAEPSGLRGLVSGHSKLYALVRTVKDRLSAEPPPDEETRWREFLARAEAAPQSLSVVDRSEARTVLTGPYRRVGVALDDPRIEEGLSVCLRLVQDMADDCAQAGRSFLVLLIPTKELVFEPLLDDVGDHPGVAELVQDEGRARRRITAALTERGIPVVDGLLALQEAAVDPRRNPYFPSMDGHPSADGHDALARLVAEHPLLED